jgi:hypothetical protein
LGDRISQKSRETKMMEIFSIERVFISEKMGKIKKISWLGP